MKSYLFGFLFSIGLSLASSSEGKLWVFLVAGSNGYSNYRHQADICHAYQIFRHNNVPAENIITMMYDDIANNEENPFPGTIINQPGGKDVYAGVAKDYTGSSVNPKNFMNVLLGNKKAMVGVNGTGRVIESGPDDIVFVNFVDHGGPGILCFPNEDLTIKELNNTLTRMRSMNKFKKLILYVEACHAGSMFDDILVDDTEIFVMTAADPNESSYACYYDDERQTYLGDLFSVNWMQESEKEKLNAHSLNHIYEKVRTKTEPKSHVEEYGDLDIGNTLISEILGSHGLIKSDGAFDTYQENVSKTNLAPKILPESILRILFGYPGRENKIMRKYVYLLNKKQVICCQWDAIDAYEVPLQILQKKLRKLEMNNVKNEAQLLRGEIRTIVENRQLVENVMDQLVLRITRENFRFSTKLREKAFSITSKNIDCYDKVLKEFSNTCFKIAKNPFVATQLHVLINACDLFNNKEKKIIRDIHHVCKNLQHMTNIV